MPGRRLAPLLAVFALSVGLPAVASGASVQVDRACYFDDGTSPKAQLAGTGFAALAPLAVTLDGQAFGNATADAAGSVGGGFDVPVLTGTTAERQHSITLAGGGASASASFSSTKVSADFSPSSGDPKKLKVHFRVFGMNLLHANSTVYVHYVAPGGRLRATFSIGKAQGPCGHILRTAKRRMFPFAAKYGLWTLQFDTSKAYHKGTGNLAYPWAQVGVRVRKIIVSL